MATDNPTPVRTTSEADEILRECMLNPEPQYLMIQTSSQILLVSNRVVQAFDPDKAKEFANDLLDLASKLELQKELENAGTDPKNR